MNMEETVTISVKHNASDLHLCNVWPAQWRKQGWMEIAPFTTPDADRLLLHWLNDVQQSVVNVWPARFRRLAGLRASAFVHQ